MLALNTKGEATGYVQFDDGTSRIQEGLMWLFELDFSGLTLHMELSYGMHYGEKDAEVEDIVIYGLKESEAIEEAELEFNHSDRAPLTLEVRREGEKLIVEVGDKAVSYVDVKTVRLIVK